MLLAAGQRARIAAQERKMSADFVAQAHSKTSLLNRSYAAARYRVPASGRKSAAYRATCRRPVRRLYPGKGKPREERVEYRPIATFAASKLFSGPDSWHSGPRDRKSGGEGKR